MSEENIKGLKELNGFLQQLAPKVERNVLRGALRAGASKELLPEAQANLMAAGAVETGELINGLKVGTKAKGGQAIAYVKAGGKHAHLAHWIEFGTRPHNIRAKIGGFLSFLGRFATEVMHPGMKPRPFMRPTLDSAGIAAVDQAARYMRDRLASKHGLDTSHVRLPGDEL